MWSGIWSVAITRIGFWTWIWSVRHCGLGQEVACWFQCWNNSNWFGFWKNSLALLMRKWMSLLLRKNHLLRCCGWLSLLSWIRALTLSLLLKLPPRKLEPWFVLWSFFLLRLLCISINLPYGHAWNTVVMSGLVLLAPTWKCWISYKTNMQNCWSFTWCHSWTLGSSLKCSQFKSFL